MKRPLTIAALFLAATMMTGCSVTPISTEKTDNPEITYEVLFNKKGCEIGRFIDQGHTVHIELCPSKGTSASYRSYTVNTGKSSYTVRIQNMQVRSPQSYFRV